MNVTLARIPVHGMSQEATPEKDLDAVLFFFFVV